MSDGFETPGGDAAATVQVNRRLTPIDLPTVIAGGKLGRYVILERAGSGGMGEVLRAYDPKLQREVALKIVRRDRLDVQARARLVREARAMAKLSHPNVVAVHDVAEGDASGDVGVILVMEYIAGSTLKQWIKQTQRPWSEVVAVFVRAGRGLAAAHAQGLLHRDFKPSNVLVSETHVVKVTDFGLAKLASDDTSGRSGAGTDDGTSGDTSQASTEAGMVMGTPRYMAPEQHQDKALGPAADQYAFCVALWEALATAPPFSGKRLAAQKRKGPPAWPHTGVPTPLVQALRRGLAVDPTDRWPSMDALLGALAYDPGARRRGWTLAIGAAAVVGTGGVAVDSWLTARAKRCTGAQAQLHGVWDQDRRASVRGAILAIGAAYAEGVWARIEPQLDGYAQAWTTMHTDACEATTVRAEQSTAVMDLRMACLHRAKVEMAAVIEVLATANAEVVRNAHDAVGGLPRLPRCADVQVLQADVEPPAPHDADGVERIRAHVATSKAQRKAGRYADAESALQQADAELERVEYDPVRTEVALERGFVLDDLGNYAAAEVALRQALRRGAQHKNWVAVQAAARELVFVVGARLARPQEGLQYRDLAEGLAQGDAEALAHLHNSVGNALYAQGKYAEAANEHRSAMALRQEALGPDHPQVAASRNNLANALNGQGKYVEAEAEHRRALALWRKAVGPDHPDVATSQSNLAVALYAQGKYAETEAAHRRTLALRLEALGPDHPKVAASRNNLGNALSAQGKHAEAVAEHRRALALWSEALGADHPNVATSRSNLGNALQSQGKYAEAEAQHRQALASRHEVLGADHPHVAASRSNLGNALHFQGRYAEAETEYREAFAVWHKALGADHPDVAASRNNLANALTAQGKYEEAETEYRGALAVQQEALGADHPQLAASRYNLARVLLVQHRAEDALPFAELAWEQRQHDDVPIETQAEAAFLLARVLWAARERASSRPRDLAKRALEGYTRRGETFAARRDEVRRWLAAHR